LQTSASFEEQRVVVVKIFHLDQFFEAEAAVLYVKPRGLGIEFREIKPHFRAVLQRWILTMLHSQPDASRVANPVKLRRPYGPQITALFRVQGLLYCRLLLSC